MRRLRRSFAKIKRLIITLKHSLHDLIFDAELSLRSTVTGLLRVKMFTLDSDNKAGIFLAQLYLLGWLLLPNLVLLLVYNETFSPLLAFLVILPISSLLYFYCFPSLKWFAWFNIPFAFIAGFYAAYIFEYRSIPYEGMWFSVWDMVYLEFSTWAATIWK